MTPLQEMLLMTMRRTPDVKAYSFILHAGEYGELDVREIVTSQTNNFAIIHTQDARVFVFSNNAVANFPIEVRAKSTDAAEAEKTMRYLLQGHGGDVSAIVA